jgi:putative oxidoreductase
MKPFTKSLAIVARTLLGLIFFVFGLNFFLHFIPSGAAPSGKAGEFLGGLFQSGYLFPLVKTIETAAGLLLLLGYYVQLVLVILMPISLNIFLFHSFLEPGAAGLVISSLILVLQLFLAWRYQDYYRKLFIARPKI